jgi:hypothetical protein
VLVEMGRIQEPKTLEQMELPIVEMAAELVGHNPQILPVEVTVEVVL